MYGRYGESWSDDHCRGKQTIRGSKVISNDERNLRIRHWVEIRGWLGRRVRVLCEVLEKEVEKGKKEMQVLGNERVHPLLHLSQRRSLISRSIQG